MNTNIISVLNELIEISYDCQEGFRKSAEHASNTSLNMVFTTCANDYEHISQELQTMVIQLGGKPTTSGSISGALHRGWTEIKATLSSNNNDLILLEECERGEDIAKKYYNQALDSELPSNVRLLIEKQYQNIIRNHNQIRDLRNQYSLNK